MYTGIGIMIFSAVFFFKAMALQKPGIGANGPGFFPALLSVLLFSGGLLLMVKGLRNRGGSALRIERGALKRVAVAMAILICAAALLNYLGFFVSCLVAAFLLQIVLKVKPVQAVILAVAISGGIYSVFHYGFHVSFP
jgi:hypothetical protein